MLITNDDSDKLPKRKDKDAVYLAKQISHEMDDLLGFPP